MDHRDSLAPIPRYACPGLRAVRDHRREDGPRCGGVVRHTYCGNSRSRISGASMGECEAVAQIWIVSQVNLMPNNAFERTVRHGGWRLAAARSSWPAAQLGRLSA